jgi:hypothetical protein
MTTEEYNDISSLLERFFEGSTTTAEEQTLYLFFSQKEDIPEEWESYRDLFAYFAKGIAGECFPEEKTFLPRRRHRLRWTAIAVASTVALLLVGRLYFHPQTPFRPYEGSYVIHNGIRITDIDLIRPELEDALQRVMAEQAKAERMFASADEARREARQIIEELNLMFQTE